MTVKNINVFKSSPIVIKINDSEQIRFDKVPALVTLTLYENEEFINDLLNIEKSMLDVSSNSPGLDERKQSKIMSVSAKIAKFCKKYYATITEALTLLFNKDERWITETLGYMDMWNILLSVFYKNAEESSELLKKNNQPEKVD